MPGIQRTNDTTSRASSSKSLSGEARSVNAAVAGASSCEGMYETGMAYTGPYGWLAGNNIASVRDSSRGQRARVFLGEHVFIVRTGPAADGTRHRAVQS